MTLTCCQDHILTENIWFVWSETSYSGDERRCYRCGTNNEQRTLKIELLSQWKLEAEFRNFFLLLTNVASGNISSKSINYPPIKIGFKIHSFWSFCPRRHSPCLLSGMLGKFRLREEVQIQARKARTRDSYLQI